MVTAPLLTLNNGIKIPQIGFGCWKVGTDVCSDVIYNAIKTGYRHFDGAMDYGNEKEIGEGIARAIADGLVKREELTIVSKLWNNYHAPKNVKLAIKKVLSDLKLDYIDVYYIHFPIAQRFVPFEEKYPPTFYCGDGDNFHFEDVPILDTWKAMEELVDEGLVKSIGISNFAGALILDLLRGCRIKPALLQIEHHPYLVQKNLIEFVQSKGITVVAYSSFGPQSFLELNMKSALDVKNLLFDHDLIKSIADKHKVSTAKVLLRWSTQRGLIIIPKSSNKDRLLGNLQVNDFDLTTAEIDSISDLDIGLRFNDPWGWDKIPIFY